MPQITQAGVSHEAPVSAFIEEMSDDPMIELQRAVGRIEGKLDTALGTIESNTKRISSLERWRSWTVGAAVAVTIMVQALWGILHGK